MVIETVSNCICVQVIYTVIGTILISTIFILISHELHCAGHPERVQIVRC